MRLVLRLVAAIAFGAVSATPVVVRAQGTANPDQRTAPGWIFTPSIAVGGTWDDNVLLVNPGTSPPSDFGAPIAPAVGLDYTGKVTRFSSGYSGSFVRYASFDELNSFQHSLRALLEHRVTARLMLFVQESFTDAPTTDVLQLAGVPFYRIGSQSNAAGGGFQAGLAKHTVLRGVYTLRSVAFDVNEFGGTQLQGGNAQEISATIDQSVSPRLVVGGEYVFTDATVNSGTPSGVSGPTDKFGIQTGSVTAQYQVAPGTRLSGAFGVAHLGGGLTHDARTGPEWRAGVVHRAAHAILSASYRRAYIPSFGFGGTFQNQEWTGGVRMPLGHTRAYVDGGVTWLNNEPLDTVQPKLQTAWFTGSVGYNTTRWLALEAFFGRTQQDTQRAGGQLERNQFGFRVVASKPIKLR